jgi:CRP-like cAMP-binding protein
MKEAQFAAGETIYREGEHSNAVYVIQHGAVEVLRHADGEDIRLGLLGRGDVFGEMGVIQDKPRSTTMKAVDDVSVLRLSRTAFLSVFGDDNPLGLPLLRMLCERLDRADERLMKDSLPGTETARMTEVESIRLLAASRSVERQIGADGIVISRLPYRVGRRAVLDHESAATQSQLSLGIHDDLALSPEHFALEEQDGVLIVRDLDSYLGTIVNGRSVSRFSSSKTIPLVFGSNLVVAGGMESSHRFTVLVERLRA